MPAVSVHWVSNATPHAGETDDEGQRVTRASGASGRTKTPKQHVHGWVIDKPEGVPSTKAVNIIAALMRPRPGMPARSIRWPRRTADCPR